MQTKKTFDKLAGFFEMETSKRIEFQIRVCF